MTVLDAQAVLAYFRGEPAREEVVGLLRAGGFISAVNVVEVVDQMVRRWGSPADDIEADIGLLVHGPGSSNGRPSPGPGTGAW